MEHFYFTFGSNHTRVTDEGEASLGACYCVVPASSEDEAREIMASARGPAWAFVYDCPEKAGVLRFGLEQVMLDDVRLPMVNIQQTSVKPVQPKPDSPANRPDGLMARHLWLADAPIKVLAIAQAMFIGGCRTSDQIAGYTGIPRSTISVCLGNYAKYSEGRPAIFEKKNNRTQWALTERAVDLMEEICLDQGLNLAKEKMPDYIELYGEHSDPFRSELTSRFRGAHEYLTQVDGIVGALYRLQAKRAEEMIFELRRLRKVLGSDLED